MSSHVSPHLLTMQSDPRGKKRNGSMDKRKQYIAAKVTQSFCITVIERNIENTAGPNWTYNGYFQHHKQHVPYDCFQVTYTITKICRKAFVRPLPSQNLLLPLLLIQKQIKKYVLRGVDYTIFTEQAASTLCTNETSEKITGGLIEN